MGVIAVNCRRKVKSAIPGGGGGGVGGCGYVVVVIGLLAKVSLRYVVFSVSYKSRHGSQKVLPSCLIVILARPDDTSSRSLAFRPLHHG